MRKILVSACLYGFCSRYDEKSQLFRNPTFLEWKNRGMLIPVCPEELGGLKTPRFPCEICNGRVINSNGEDKTENFNLGAEKVLKIARDNDIIFAIMKDGSPSCGCKSIYDGSFTGKKIAGSGICARLLLEDGFVVISEDDMSIARLLLSGSEHSHH